MLTATRDATTSRSSEALTLHFHHLMRVNGPIRAEKPPDQCGDFICSPVQREMSGVEHVHLCVRYIPG